MVEHLWNGGNIFFFSSNDKVTWAPGRQQSPCASKPGRRWTLPPPHDPKGSLQPLAPASLELVLTAGPAASVLPVSSLFPFVVFEPLHQCCKFRSEGKKGASLLLPRVTNCQPPPPRDFPSTHPPTTHLQVASRSPSFVTSCSWCSCCSRSSVKTLSFTCLSALKLHSHALRPTAPLHNVQVPLPKYTSHCKTTPGRSTKCSLQPRPA